MTFREVAREFLAKYERQQVDESTIPPGLRSVIWVNGTGFYPEAAKKFYGQVKKEFA